MFYAKEWNLGLDTGRIKGTKDKDAGMAVH